MVRRVLLVLFSVIVILSTAASCDYKTELIPTPPPAETKENLNQGADKTKIYTEKNYQVIQSGGQCYEPSKTYEKYTALNKGSDHPRFETVAACQKDLDTKARAN